MRIGHGFDVHRFGDGSEITIGGVKIPHHQGLEAHSDGDVLIHALCDAILGALGLGDIGRHFPDSDSRWKDADSRALLEAVCAMAIERKWKIENADMTLIAQAPRFSSYIDSMRLNLAADMNIEASGVNIKATTTEGLGYTGRSEGIAAHAVVLLTPASS